MMAHSPITLSPELQAVINGAAARERRDPAEILTDAIKQHERGKKLAELGAYGRRQARHTGLKSSDVDRIIHEDHQQIRNR